MKNTHSEETRSYRDPIATRVRAAGRRKEALEAEYPGVRTAYDGFYLRLEELSEEGNRFFLGAEGIIGSELSFIVRAQADSELQLEEAVLLTTKDGRELASISGKRARKLALHLSDGWRCKALLCTTFFRAQDKSCIADIACICWAPEDAVTFKADLAYDAALENFSRNIAERLAKGDRADLSLSQEQYNNVLRSGGEWFLTPTVKREPLQKGAVVYKSQRSGTERIAGFAFRHRMGCNILASIFWVLLIAGIVALVWFFFF